MLFGLKENFRENEDMNFQKIQSIAIVYMFMLTRDYRLQGSGQIDFFNSYLFQNSNSYNQLKKLIFPAVWGATFRRGKVQQELIILALESLKYLEEELKGKKVTGLKLVTEEKFPLLFEWMALFSGSPLIKENQPDRDNQMPCPLGDLLHKRAFKISY
ncbi:hypothetical protein CUMW_072460 [Citrus unshiu]|nr:hypothetical protein CUMW_072460 [Citrus unshiu]